MEYNNELVFLKSEKDFVISCISSFNIVEEDFIFIEEFTSGERLRVNIIDIYEDILRGSRKRFPNRFWTNENMSKKYLLICLKYLIEKKLGLSDKEILECVDVKFLRKYKLWSGIYLFFNGSPVNAVLAIYPKRFKIWQFKQVPRNYWNLNNIREDFNLFLELEYDLKEDEEKFKVIPELINYDFLDKSNFRCPLRKFFSSSPYKFINYIYPNVFKPWQFNNVPINYWDKEENIKFALKWFFEEKIDLNKYEEENRLRELSFSSFKEVGLGVLIYKNFNYSIYKAVDYIYPKRFKPWQFSRVCNSYWDKEENIREALMWLIEDKLGIKGEEDLKVNLYKVDNHNVFMENGLDGLLHCKFRGSPFRAINYIYPNVFKPWQFRRITLNYWDNKENVVKAIKWLIEEELKLEVNENLYITREVFMDYGLLVGVFKWYDTCYDALSDVYPNIEFKKLYRRKDK